MIVDLSRVHKLLVVNTITFVKETCNNTVVKIHQIYYQAAEIQKNRTSLVSCGCSLMPAPAT